MDPEMLNQRASSLAFCCYYELLLRRAQTSDMCGGMKDSLFYFEKNIQGFGKGHMIFFKVPPAFLNKTSWMRKHGGQKELELEKHDKDGWKSKLLVYPTPRSRFPTLQKICSGLILLNNKETQIKLMLSYHQWFFWVWSFSFSLKPLYCWWMGNSTRVSLKYPSGTDWGLWQGSGILRSPITSAGPSHYYSTQACPNVYCPFEFTPMLLSRKEGLFGKDSKNTAKKHDDILSASGRIHPFSLGKYSSPQTLF